MTAAAWQLQWWVPWTLPAAGIVVLWALMHRAKQADIRRTAERDARFAALRAELEERRQATGWYQSQAYFDAECECIEIAERALSRQRHPTARHPRNP
jgi:hypothetical protein